MAELLMNALVVVVVAGSGFLHTQHELRIPRKSSETKSIKEARDELGGWKEVSGYRVAGSRWSGGQTIGAGGQVSLYSNFLPRLLVRKMPGAVAPLR
jgi:hypothetical protein